MIDSSASVLKKAQEAAQIVMECARQEQQIQETIDLLEKEVENHTQIRCGFENFHRSVENEINALTQVLERFVQHKTCLDMIKSLGPIMKGSSESNSIENNLSSNTKNIEQKIKSLKRELTEVQSRMQAARNESIQLQQEGQRLQMEEERGRSL